jgi:hypothetical protein
MSGDKIWRLERSCQEIRPGIGEELSGDKTGDWGELSGGKTGDGGGAVRR